MYEFIGILDTTSTITSSHDDDHDHGSESNRHSETTTLRPSSVEESEIMSEYQHAYLQIHCVAFFHVTSYHLTLSASNHRNDKVPKTTDYFIKQYDHLTEASSSSSSIQVLREAIILYLSNFMNNDQVAAEYLFLSCFGKVYGRVEDTQYPLGPLAMNFIAPTQEQRLGAGLANIIPLCKTMDISISSLCEDHLSPYKDYENHGALQNGQLQLAHGTTLILDESKLLPGKLTEQGLKNVKQLQKVCTQQQLAYDFQYYEIDFPVVRFWFIWC